MSYIENVCGWYERENVSIGKFDGQNVSIVIKFNGQNDTSNGRKWLGKIRVR